ncbi:MAG TPA: CRTAC1 family protein, partial [Fimbriiglobus sp.]|nr:CRTAC1 family protein [Fimbriiglobus sp.]
AALVTRVGMLPHRYKPPVRTARAAGTAAVPGIGYNSRCMTAMTLFSRHRYLFAALLGGAGVVAAVALWLFPPTGSSNPRRDDVPFPDVRFTDVTDAAGIRFHHVNGAAGRKLLPETMGAGVAVLDYDRDGRPDLFFVNSRPWPGASDGRPTQALYRNQGDGTFADVTAAVGLDVTLYGLGAAVGDFDADGWPDLFVTALGGGRLYRNLGGQRFDDVTGRVGLPVGALPDVPADEFHKWSEPIPWPSSATFLDYDGDGRLDLFVCSYVTWSPAHDLGVNAVLPGGRRAYVPPTQFPGAHCLLYRNLGERFEDVSAAAGVQVSDPVGRDSRPEPIGKALGVVACDPDADGWPDLIVADDTVRNFFFHNVSSSNGRRFEEIGLTANVAYAEGRPRGGMGIDYGEVRPGRPAAVVANFTNEPATLLALASASPLLFRDTAAAEGLTGPSRGPMKFGALFLDYDLDGRNDLLTCNGHLEPDIALSQPGQSHPQPAQLYWSTDRDGHLFEPVAEANAGPDLFQPRVGRGCAYLDYDGDGDLDLVLTANNGRARLLRNDNRTGNHWLRFDVGGAIGAEVTVESGGVVRRWHVAGARGYLSQSEQVVTVGLGRSAKADKVTVRWPGINGVTRTWTDLPAGRVHRLKPR